MTPWSGGFDESITRTVKREVSDVVAVPEITPEAVRVNPAGRLPASRDQRYGAVPPLALRVDEYGTPTVGLGSAPDTKRGEANVNPRVAERGGSDESVTITLKDEVAGLRASPESTPDGDRVIPSGRLPETTDQ